MTRTKAPATPPQPHPAPDSEAIWTRPERASRGPKPMHDRGEIARAAIAIADREGIAAVSMRELARALGTGATSLYRYVQKKDELFDLMIDAVMGEEVPPRATGEWRADLYAIAVSTRSLSLRHPWMVPLIAFRTTLGPNNLRWIECTLAAVDGLGLSIDEMLLMANTLLIFVRGHVTAEVSEQDAARRSGMTREQWMTQQGAYGEAIQASGAFPLFCRVMDEAEEPHAPDLPDRAFAQGLDHVLDGFAVRISGGVKKPPRRRR